MKGWLVPLLILVLVVPVQMFAGGLGNPPTNLGDLTVQGVTTTIGTTTLLIKDKNIELGAVTTPTDITADGGGITLKASTDITIQWLNATNAWTFNQGIDLLGNNL